MRNFINSQINMGEVAIENIDLDLKSRDEIPHLLLGLQHIYSDVELRRKVEKILEKLISDIVSTELGRPGMILWRILVMGVIRVGCNIDFDKLRELANNHIKIREFLGHSIIDRSEYSLTTLKDNVQLITPEIIDEINLVVCQTGHKLIKKNGKSEDDKIKVRIDSFVAKTDVHYPTEGVASVLCRHFAILRYSLSSTSQRRHHGKRFESHKNSCSYTTRFYSSGNNTILQIHA